MDFLDAILGEAAHAVVWTACAQLAPTRKAVGIQESPF
jgi:hypothetical protein